MVWCQQHEFQVLTKRSRRLRQYVDAMAMLSPQDRSRRIVTSMYAGHPAEHLVRDPAHVGDFPWPLPNVRLGVSVENQAMADERFPDLIAVGEAGWNTMVSLEPLLYPVVIPDGYLALGSRAWVIVGGESGKDHRPFTVDWMRAIADQCRAAGVPLFVKQDSAPKPGQQGRIPDDLWIQEFPREIARPAMATTERTAR